MVPVDPGPRRRVVQGPGQERRRRPQVRRHQRRRGAARRLRDRHGDAGPPGHLRSRRRRGGRPPLKAWAPSGPSSGFLPALAARHAARFRVAGRRRLDARLGRLAGAATMGVHARHGAQRRALLPQRVVRQVRALPGGLGQDGGGARRDRAR